ISIITTLPLIRWTKSCRKHWPRILPSSQSLRTRLRTWKGQCRVDCDSGDHVKQKQIVGQAPRLPNCGSGQSASRTGLATVGATGDLFRDDLRRESAASAGKRNRTRGIQGGHWQTRKLENSCGDANARSFARDRRTNKQSRREARKFFRRAKALDPSR